MNALEYKITGKDALAKRLLNAGTVVTTALLYEMKAQMARAADWSRANRLSGDPLHRRSGRLSRSVTPDATLEGGVIRGTIGSNVPYAKVHELGGTFAIPAHTRTSRLGNPFTVQSHTATFEQRAFLRPALENNRSQIIAGLKAAAVRSLQK